MNKMESELKANEDAIDRLGQEMEEAEEQTDDFAESLSDSGDMQRIHPVSSKRSVLLSQESARLSQQRQLP